MKIFPLWLFAFCSLPPLAFGQGPLTPPAAPTPTMKTLDQVEARTPIPSAAVGLVPPFGINQSGSYYLTANIAVTSGNAIQISADGVTLDLNGFTISSSAATAGGIAINVISGSNITIRNGFISGTTTVSGSVFSGGGFSDGIGALSGSTNVTVERISIRGMGGTGIGLPGTGTVVRSCCTNITAGRGIVAELITNSTVEAGGGSSAINGTTVSGCRATNVSTSFQPNGIVANFCTDSTGIVSFSGGVGISTITAMNCTGTTSGSGNGLSASAYATNCNGDSVSGIGLSAPIAINCRGSSNNGTGLSATNATNCSGFSNTSIGLSAINATNCLGTTSSALATVFGLACSGTATGCRGTGGGGSSVALQATIAIGCTVTNGTATIANRYNMP